MSDETLKMLMKALAEELDARKMKPQFHLITEDPSCTIGEWCRRDQAFKAFGLSTHRLKQLVIDGKVIAKKMAPNEPTSVIVFRTADIRKAINDLPNYTYDNKKDVED